MERADPNGQITVVSAPGGIEGTVLCDRGYADCRVDDVVVRLGRGDPSRRERVPVTQQRGRGKTGVLCCYGSSTNVSRGASHDD
jgi:hypothetical protein